MQSEIENTARRFVGYFKATVLAQYRAEPHKFKLVISDFEGEVGLNDAYAETLDTGQRDAESIRVRFGFRRHSSGEYYLAVFASDFPQHARGHIERWLPYTVDPAEMSPLPDARFESWAKRYLLGLWEVDSNVIERLHRAVGLMNALTTEVFGKPLFSSATNPGLHTPITEQTHAYEDAHRELYGLLIDGVDTEVVNKLLQRAKIIANTTDRYTVQRLKRCFPKAMVLWDVLDLVGQQRGKAAHRVRPPAQRFAAFETFCGDLEKVVTGLSQLRSELENLLGASSEVAMDRQRAKSFVPKTGGPPCRAAVTATVPTLTKIVGRTVKCVTLTQRESLPDVHQSELLEIAFTDGSVLHLHTCTNACNVSDEHGEFPPTEFDVYFDPYFVPPPVTK